MGCIRDQSQPAARCSCFARPPLCSPCSLGAAEISSLATVSEQASWLWPAAVGRYRMLPSSLHRETGRLSMLGVGHLFLTPTSLEEDKLV